MIVLSPLGGSLMDRWGSRWPATVGTSLTALGAIPLLVISETWAWYAYLAPLMLVGVGLGLSTAPVQATAIQTVPRHQAGQAAGFFSTMRYMGSILGSSMLAALLSGTRPPAETFRMLNAVLLLSACGAILTAWALPARLTSGDAAEPGASLPEDLVRR
jgi:MFS family permease